jgi:hypothetical protein
MRAAGLAVVVCACVLLIPAAAWACPVCASRETDTRLVLVLIGAMIAVPYVIAAIAIRVIRRIQRDDGAQAAAEASR